MTACLIIAIGENGVPVPGALSCVTAAKALGAEADILTLSAESAEQCALAAACATIDGVRAVTHATLPDFAFPIAERVCGAAQAALQAGAYRYVMMPADTYGKDILPRLAALQDADAVTDVTDIAGALHLRRPVHAGNIIADITVDENTPLIALTVRASRFARAAATGGNARIIALNYSENAHAAFPEYIETVKEESDLPELTSARRVISGGRGTGSKEAFDTLYSFAKTLGDCAVGASRAAVDAGYAPNDMQVGQTGKIVAPELYIAAGISGAVQHQAGIKDSGIIVAINTDENAPIFDIADIGLVADMFDALPALEKKIAEG